MPPYNISLRFRGDKSLRRATNLVLTFDKQDMEGIYKEFNPVVWKVTSFPAGGGSAIFRAAYVADLAFTRAQVADGVLQSAEYSTHINPGQQTTLTQDSSIQPPTYSFSKPVPWNEAFGSNFKCENRTGDRQNIGIGFYEPGKNKPTSALVVTDVPGNTDVVASFTPILSAYVVTGYQENQILKAQIRGGLDWAKDLADNRIDKNWLLTESNDGFHLIRDDEA